MAAKVQGKTHSYLWLRHLLSDQKQRPNLRQIQQPVPEQMGRCVHCSVLFYSQFIIIPHLQIPSPKQTFVPATMPAIPAGWTGSREFLSADRWWVLIASGLEPSVLEGRLWEM